jgi:AcrR family transcriptional regulator
MNDEAEPPLREQDAVYTRLLVRDAGHRLFARDGFVVTSIEKIAYEAGVSEQTVYAHYRNKVEIFQDALDVAMRDRPEIPGSSDAGRMITEMVRGNGAVLERAGALIMAGIGSSGADQDMRRISDEGVHAMRVNCLALAEALAETGEVREELDTEAVADVLTTMMSPHVHQLLGWPANRYEAWLAGTLKETLLNATRPRHPPEASSASQLRPVRAP